jgi:hypothetical protein
MWRNMITECPKHQTTKTGRENAKKNNFRISERKEAKSILITLWIAKKQAKKNTNLKQ